MTRGLNKLLINVTCFQTVALKFVCKAQVWNIQSMCVMEVPVVMVPVRAHNALSDAVAYWSHVLCWTDHCASRYHTGNWPLETNFSSPKFYTFCYDFLHLSVYTLSIFNYKGTCVNFVRIAEVFFITCRWRTREFEGAPVDSTLTG